MFRQIGWKNHFVIIVGSWSQDSTLLIKVKLDFTAQESFVKIYLNPRFNYLSFIKEGPAVKKLHCNKLDSQNKFPGKSIVKMSQTPIHSSM